MQVVFSMEISYRVTVSSKRLQPYRPCIWCFLNTKACAREKLDAFLWETLEFLEKTGTIVNNSHAVCDGFTGQMSSSGSGNGPSYGRLLRSCHWV